MANEKMPAKRPRTARRASMSLYSCNHSLPSLYSFRTLSRSIFISIKIFNMDELRNRLFRAVTGDDAGDVSRALADADPNIAAAAVDSIGPGEKQMIQWIERPATPLSMSVARKELQLVEIMAKYRRRGMSQDCQKVPTLLSSPDESPSTLGGYPSRPS